MIHSENIFSQKITLQTFVVLFLASCFYLYEFIAQVSPGTIAHNLMHDFAIDATQLGFISSSFYVTYIPMQLITGLLLDRYSARVILTSISAICALGVLIFAYAPNFYIAILARLIIGGAAASAFIGVLHLALRWIPPIYFAFFAGIVEMMGSIGGALASKPFAVLLKQYDWHTIFAALAYTGFTLSCLIALFVKNRPANLQKITLSQTTTNFIRHNLKAVLHKRETWLLGIYSFLIWAPLLGFAGLWGVPFLRVSCTIDHVTAANALLYIWIGVAVTSPIIGWLSDYIERRLIIMTICGLAGAIATSLTIFITNIPLFWLKILMFTLGAASAAQTLSFALVKDTNSPLTSSTANGFINMCVVTGGILPAIIGILLDATWQGILQNGVHIYSLHGYRLAMLILPICYSLAALTSAFGIKETHCRHVWQEKEG